MTARRRETNGAGVLSTPRPTTSVVIRTSASQRLSAAWLRATQALGYALTTREMGTL